MVNPVPHIPSEAFIRALTESQSALRGYCQASLGHGEEAKEALQRTNIVLWRKCEDWDSETEFLRWAISVAKGRKGKDGDGEDEGGIATQPKKKRKASQ